jgi:hypothetical protein
MVDCPCAEADPANNAMGSPKYAIRNALNPTQLSFMFFLLDPSGVSHGNGKRFRFSYPKHCNRELTQIWIGPFAGCERCSLPVANRSRIWAAVAGSITLSLSTVTTSTSARQAGHQDLAAFA